MPEDEIAGLTSALTLLGGSVVHSDDEFADFAPVLAAPMPKGSPLRRYGGYHHEAELQRGMTGCGCARGWTIHGHDHQRAWLSGPDVADPRSVWGALGAGAILGAGLLHRLGWTAERLVAAGACAALMAAAATRLPLPASKADLTPSHHWPDPVAAGSGPDSDRAAMITVTYQIDPAGHARFAERIERLAKTRRRNGAVSWGVFSEVADAQRVVE